MGYEINARRRERWRTKAIGTHSALLMPTPAARGRKSRRQSEWRPQGYRRRNSARSSDIRLVYLIGLTPQVANMPTAAAAMTAVASHPRMASGFVSTNSPISALREAMSMIIAMIGTAATPLMMALQISALTGSSGVKLKRGSDKGCGRYRKVEGRSAPRPLGKAYTPVQRFA
jgi:hypothetical protein